MQDQLEARLMVLSVMPGPKIHPVKPCLSENIAMALDVEASGGDPDLSHIPEKA